MQIPNDQCKYNTLIHRCGLFGDYIYLCSDHGDCRPFRAVQLKRESGERPGLCPQLYVRTSFLKSMPLPLRLREGSGMDESEDLP